ncbi:MAG: hypothetical protein UR51_C0011G0018 [Candidatus Moranbacteria bacterium GW2011_GWF1_34_10]|nr:MAG: hypothetical protein UR51_C0011G0018 [Candidatus Moranbacteria bacterium GW2011_GWF1_34_10]
MDSVFSLKSKKEKNKPKVFSNEKLESVLFSKGIRRDKFFTNDSGLYFDCNDKELANLIAFRLKNKLFDSLNHKAIKDYSKFGGNYNDFLFVKYRLFVKKIQDYQQDIVNEGNSFFDNVSLLKMWNTSILAAIIIGMISMSFIYRYLGSGASAGEDASNKEVAGLYIEKEDENKWTKEKEEAYLMEMSDYLQEEADKDFDKRAMELVKGYPIEKMMPYILKKDRQVAAFFIAIAKKESNWGKRVPVLDGQDCYNYLGYRGKRDKMGSGGHTCFDSRKDAVDTIAKRLEELIKKYDRNTPAEMVVWKCGSNCNVTGGQAAANKWISDVDMYLEKLSDKD